MKLAILYHSLLAIINWNPQKEIFQLTIPEILGFGPTTIAPLWYSMGFMVGFMIGYYIVFRMFKREGEDVETLDELLLVLMLGTVFGARIGHCVFYDWAYYSQHLIEIFLPIQTEPTLKFTGFLGLASHGGAMGVLIAQWWYCKNTLKKPLIWLLDRIGVPVILVGALIRLGNLMNSEIIGNPTDVSWAFVFEKVDMIPRHPVQLYESFAYFIIFGILSYLYWKTDIRHKTGRLLGVFTVLLWTTRFGLEYFKRDMGGIENALGLFSTGQWLSIPLILVGLYFMFRPLKTV